MTKKRVSIALLLLITLALILLIAQNIPSLKKLTNVETEEQLADKDSSYPMTEKTVKFLWIDYEFDEELQCTIRSTFIDKEYCKTISDPEKAALGYIASFIDNDCDWDENNVTVRALKCEIITALNLGYHCSPRHLSFLRHWFRYDEKALKELENCGTVPITATMRNHFEEIILTVKGNEIVVFFEVSGLNSRSLNFWSWTEINYFRYDNNSINLIKIELSQPRF